MLHKQQPISFVASLLVLTSLFLLSHPASASEGALEVQCDIYGQCNTCASNGCAWCAHTQVCQTTNANTTGCGCVKTTINQGSQCSSQPCSTYPYCYGCVAGGCGWCEDTQSCVESKPLSLPAGPCVTGDCVNAKCWKNITSNNFQASKCTSGDCSIYTECFDCTKNGCAWCETSQQCLPSNIDGTNVCGADNSCNNTKQCLKNNYSPNYMATKCPQINCAEMFHCRQCIQNGCGWCESTHTCQSVMNDGTNSCVSGGCASADACFKSSMDANGNPYQDKCTMVNCDIQINCESCASAGCGWCETTQTCLPISSNASQTCGSQGCPDLPSCLKSMISVNASKSKCSSLPCDSFNGNCYVCVESGCGWCAATQQCIGSTYPGDEGPCGAQCDVAGGCWKSNDTVAAKCSPRPCESLMDCATCTNLGCGWCAWNSTCLEAQFFPNSSIQSPGPCGSGGCPNPEKCWKTDSSQQCGLGLPKCSSAGSCRSCVTTPGVSCAWCHTERQCGELSSDGMEVCADCDQDIWNIISTISDCFDCNFDVCDQGAACNITTGNCICPLDYFGPACDIFCTPEANCSGSGQCLINPDQSLTCVCNEFYYGDTCQHYCNPNVTCSGHGHCNITGGPLCECDNEWQDYNGSFCSLCPAPFFGEACALCCDRAINCSNNGICENCTCKCYVPYTELNCSRFIGIYPAHAWEITIGLFVGLAIATIVTCVLISGQLVKMNPREFPGVIYLSKFTNIISIGVSLLAYGQLILYAFKPPESWLPDPSSNSSSDSSSIVDGGQPTIHLPFDISLPEVSYPIWFWCVFGTCVFFFVCSLWVLITARFAPFLSHAVQVFVLDVILTCVWPGIGSGLYFPIMENLFSVFNCKYVEHSAKMYLIADKNIVCFEHDHIIYLICSGIALVLYYPLCLRILPMSQSMKRHYVHYRHHIIYQPKFLLFEAQTKLLILLSRMYFTSQTEAYELWTSISLFVCISLLFMLTLIMRPCVSSGKVNLWRCVGYVIVLCAVVANFLTFLLPPPSYLPSFILLASWVVVLFFAIFLHRAIFHKKITLSKYWSMSRDVKGEHAPLVIKRLSIQD